MMMAAVALMAQDRTVERTYVTTDRDTYVAGDRVWCSAFCIDASTGRLSKVSSTAYLELHSAEGLAQTAKIELVDGRGAGCITLSGTLPTGNYRLLAYTAQNKAEAGFDCNALTSRTISVFNVLSRNRVKDGVEVIEDAEYATLEKPQPVQAGNLTVEAGPAENGTIPVTVRNNGAAATLSVSIFHEDGVAHPVNASVGDFISAARKVGPKTFAPASFPEYEGEVIRGYVAGASAGNVSALAGKYAFISAPGDAFDIYASRIDSAGRVSFFTGNIYGDRDLVCEIEGVDSMLACHLELEKPFIGAEVTAPQTLKLSSAIADALKARGAAMQIERRFCSDTLLDLLRLRNNSLLGEDCRSYILDDYTRFPLMKEVFVEFIPEIRAERVSRDNRTLQVRLKNGLGDSGFSKDSSLILLDGVPVFDHNRIYNYSPLLVKRIDAYEATHYIGDRSFDGVANFVTYKGNLPSMTFSGNVRVISFQGVSYPQAYTGASLPSDYPDYRQTIYWHPLVEVPAGASVHVPCRLPSYAGDFVIVVEGMAADGAPVTATASFSTR